MITPIGPRANHVQIPIHGEPVTDEEEFEYRPVTGYVPGYHVNIARADLTPELRRFRVSPDPATPHNTFAGDERGKGGRWKLTAFLMFDDEPKARRDMPDKFYRREDAEADPGGIAKDRLYPGGIARGRL